MLNTPRLAVVTPRIAEMIPIPPGIVQIGDNAGSNSEKPAFSYFSHGFLMDRTPVTVAQFVQFVRDTGYQTSAERDGMAGVLDERSGGWIGERGASWRKPTGPKEASAQSTRPVTQVSWIDADVFCRAYGLRLPTEFEWERAARMGQTPGGHVFGVNDSIEVSHRFLLNGWQGIFPLNNTGADGYRTTSPVGAFGAAPSGLTDMAGNVWEWTDSWYLPYGSASAREGIEKMERVSRGGSFLCSAQYCQGYRASARNHATPDTALENVGFRCATSLLQPPPRAGRTLSVNAALSYNTRTSRSQSWKGHS